MTEYLLQIGEAESGFGFNGEYYNATTGQIYLRARFYEPEMARFGQKDIVRGTITDALSLNRYSYCENDPVNFVDPSGMRQVIDTTGASVASKPKTTTTSTKTSSKPVQSQTQYVNPTNIPRSNAASVADSKAAMDYLNRTAPNSPQAQRARDEYRKTVEYANIANATHNPYFSRLAQENAMKNVSFANNVTPAKPSGNSSSTGGNSYTPTTSSPTVQSPVSESGNCGKKAVAIGIEIIKALFNSVEISAGIGQGIGASGSVKLGEDNISFSLKTSANYAELRIDDGVFNSGMSYSNEAYIGILTGKFGVAKNEISDWDGNWEIDDSSTFKGIVPETSVGFSASAYFIVGISVDAEFNYIEFLNQIPQIICNVEEAYGNE